MEPLKKNTEVRLSVIETVVDEHERRISNMEEYHQNVIDRLDQKILADMASQITIEKTLERALVSIEAIVSTIPKIGQTADAAHKMADKHQTIGIVLLKVGSVIGALGAAGWAVFHYLLTK